MRYPIEFRIYSANRVISQRNLWVFRLLWIALVVAASVENLVLTELWQSLGFLVGILIFFPILMYIPYRILTEPMTDEYRKEILSEDADTEEMQSENDIEKEIDECPTCGLSLPSLVNECPACDNT